MVVSRGLAGPNRARSSVPGKGKQVNIPVPWGYASRQRKGQPLTSSGRRTRGLRDGGDLANRPKALEYRHGEKEPKAGMARVCGFR